MQRADPRADAIWQYRDDVRLLARRLCRSREDAEDVTQNALLKAAQQVGTFRREASLRTWLHRIATNECRMLHRRKVAISLDELGELGSARGGAPAEPPAAAMDPEQAALDAESRAESRRLVAAALTGMPDRYRTAVLLSDALGMNAGDVATALGITVPAARSVLHRARLALRQRLGDLAARGARPG